MTGATHDTTTGAGPQEVQPAVSVRTRARRAKTAAPAAQVSVPVDGASGASVAEAPAGEDEAQEPAQGALSDYAERLRYGRELIGKALDPGSVPKNQRSEVGAVVADFVRIHGVHVIRRGEERAPFTHIPSDIFTLDMGLHGGIPRSLISMLYGWESSGKSTCALRIMAQAQRLYPDNVIAYVDVEGTYDPTWGETHGLDNERLVLAQPASGEQAVDLIRGLTASKEVVLVVLDSIPALMPVKEADKSVFDETVALQARLVGKLCRNVTQVLIQERQRQHYPAVLFVNQFRNKIQMMGDPRTLPGGNALKYFVSVRWEVKNKEHMGKDAQDNEVVDFNEHTWAITKNKIGNGLRNGVYTMIRNPDHPLGPGFIDDARAVLTFARKFGLVTGGGSAWCIDGYNDHTGKAMRFRSLAECEGALYSDLDFYTALKHRLVAIQRGHNGLSTMGFY